MYRIKQLILLSGDLLSFYVALWISVSLRYWSIPDIRHIETLVPLFFTTFFLWVVLNFINGLYDLERLAKKTIFRRFAQTALVSFVMSAIFFYLFPTENITPKTILGLNIIFGYGLSALWRMLYVKIFGGKTLLTNVVIVGYTPEVRELIDILKAAPEKGYHIAAVIDPDKQLAPGDVPGTHVYQGLQTIRPAITNYHASLVVIAPHLRQDSNALRELYELLFWHVRISDLPSFYEIVTGRVPPSTFSESWFLDHLKNREQPIYDKFRTLVDFSAAFLMLIVCVVLFPFIALAIKLNSKGPLFIKQKRVGQFGKHFTLYKFRSMYALSPDGSAEVNGAQFAQKDDKRVTAVGQFMRKTRLDELPQCINLFKRDLTFIGPRPERPEVIKKLEEEMPYYSIRHVIKPGLTGWAVIQQDYADTLKDALIKLQYDVFYIKNRSLLLDLSILLRTVNVILWMKGQ